MYNASQTDTTLKSWLTILTIVTLASRRSLFSSCRALHLSLNVSSSIFSTLFSCWREASRFVNSSKRKEEMTMLGLVEDEEDVHRGTDELLLAPSVSLSLALSAMITCGDARFRNTTLLRCFQT